MGDSSMGGSAEKDSMGRVRLGLSAFACAQQGNVAMILAIAAPMLIALIFAVVDLSRMSSAKSGLQDALGAAL